MQKIVLTIFFLWCFNLLFGGVYGPYSPSVISNLPYTGSSASWTDVANVSTLDGSESGTSSSLSVNGSYSDYLLATNFNAQIPAGEVIVGIFVEVNRRTSSSPKTKDQSIMMYYGGFIGSDQAGNSSWPGAATYDTYGGASDMLGTSLSDSEVNSVDFGVAISVRKSSGSGSIDPFIDHIRITIYTLEVLPVQLLYFDLRAKQEGVEIRWTTASEINNDYFIIEKSGNAVDFISIDTVKGNGTSQHINEYFLHDKYPVNGMNYYRLKQVDFDGKISTHEIKVIEFNNNSIVNVYPTISSGEVSIDLNNSYEEVVNIEVYDSSGRLINTTSEIQPLITLNINSTAGLYYLKINRLESASISKLIIE